MGRGAGPPSSSWSGKRLHAAGHGKFGRFIVTLPLVTVALATLRTPLDLLHFDRESPLYMVSDLTWPLSMLLTLTVGAAALFARVLPLPQRLVPLFCGLALPLTIGYTVLARLEEMSPSPSSRRTPPSAGFCWG